jgi:sec-independent protein translocase protein TatC
MSERLEHQGQEEQPQETFIGHLLELRSRLMRAILGVLLIFVVLMPFARSLYRWLADPLLAHLPAGAGMIATEVASPFLTPFKLALVAAFFLAAPWVLYQAWAFIAPGLYQKERRMAAPMVAASSLLFYLGGAFAYFVVFPLVFGFLSSAAPEGVTMMTDIRQYLDFVMVLLLAFGIAFQVPIVTILLIRMGVVERADLAAKRSYIIVAAFIIGMLLTPPDMISQTLLAIPMWLLFEVGLLVTWFMERGSAKQADS